MFGGKGIRDTAGRAVPRFRTDKKGRSAKGRGEVESRGEGEGREGRMEEERWGGKHKTKIIIIIIVCWSEPWLHGR